MRGKGRFIVLFCIVLAVHRAHALAAPDFAVPIVVTDSFQRAAMGPHLSIYEDRGGTLAIDEVAHPSFKSKFRAAAGESLNFGYTDSTYWLRFTLDNRSRVHERLLLELVSYLSLMELYLPDGAGRYAVRRYHRDQPAAERDMPHRNIIYYLPRSAAIPAVYYLRFHSDGSVILPLTLWSMEAFAKKDHEEQFVFGIYFGFLMVMIIYNLFLFTATRERSYLYYVLYITGFLYLASLIWGFASEFIMNEFFLRHTGFFNPTVSLTVISASLFSRHFLDLKKNSPFMDRFMKVQIGAALAAGVFSLWAGYGTSMRISLALGLLLVGSMTISGAYCFIRGYRPARFFILSFLAISVGMTLFILRNLGIVPYTFVVNYAPQIGSALEVTLLSFALADKINILKDEREGFQLQAIDNLKHSDRIKDEFLANTSHELRTPLNGIIGLAEALLDRARRHDLRHDVRDLSLIISSGRRLSHLVNDILDYSRLKNSDIILRRAPVDIHSQVDVVLNLLQPLVAHKELVLENAIPPDCPHLWADENRTMQILHNLIGNAIKFTDAGSVTVGVDAERGRGFVRITVTDTGIGVPGDRRESIFLPFEQADASMVRAHGGTGIGLSIAKQLVLLHGGVIGCESRPGGGSVFYFTLPRARDAALPTAPRSDAPYVMEDEAPPVAGDGSSSVVRGAEGAGRILVVDDDVVNIEVALNFLRGEQYTVVTAAGGAEALAIIERYEKETRHYFDLVLLDIMMPGMSGFEACRRLREDFSLFELPVLFLTARQGMEDLVSGFSEGANDYIVKPLNREELLVRVRTLVKLKRSAQEHEELRYRLLQDRMKPHFLFNALNSVYYLMRRDPARAGRALLMLSNIYRFFTDEVMEELIPFDREWQFVTDYLGFIEAQHLDQISVSIERTGEFGDVFIPSLSIQPLVENSFKHGLRNPREGAVIRVRAARHDGEVLVTVEDNGEGLVAGTINSRTLDNIRQRLRHRYRTAEITVENRPGGGARSLLRIVLED